MEPFDVFEEESDAEPFFYSTDELGSYFKRSPPKFEKLLGKLSEKKLTTSRTHFNPVGFKTNATISQIKKLF